jgi:hypothetical protein
MRQLNEKLTYDQLFRMSDPKRTIRSFKVKGPPLEIDSYQDAVYYAFNFKSSPSTTGLRHRGYVKFLRPKLGGQKPLQHLNCIVDCTCPDFRYRWAWANKQRGASRVGPQSLNQALNRAPRRTNPTSKPGLCKHVLAAREYVYGLLSSFPNDEPDTADKLNKLTQFATKRWINMDAEMDAARDRQARIAAARNLRNAGQPAPQDIALDQEAPGDEEPHEPGDEEAYQNVVPPEIEDAPELAQLPPPPTSFAAKVRPPSERGRTLPTAQVKDRIRKGTPAAPPSKIGDRAAKAGFNSPAAYNFARRQGLGDSVGYAAAKNETNDVVMTNGQKDMNALTEAQRIISELEQDELASLRAAGQEDDQDSPEALPPAGDMGGGDEFNDGGAMPPQGGEMGAGEMGGDLPPSEPPVSDSAVGADSEGQLALGLLREIAGYLGQLAAALAPAPEPEEAAAGEGEGGGEFGGEPEDGEEIPVEDPSEEAEAESEGEEGEHNADSAEEEEEEKEEAARS